MNTSSSQPKQYTIRETAKISGLPTSTLRYYETIGLISPVERDNSSKYRVYSDDDVHAIVGLACLNAIGFSIEDMREYLSNRDDGESGVASQVELLTRHADHIRHELHDMQLRLQYVESKAVYWEAIRSGDKAKIQAVGEKVYAIADKMKLPKPTNTRT